MTSTASWTSSKVTCWRQKDRACVRPIPSRSAIEPVLIRCEAILGTMRPQNMQGTVVDRYFPLTTHVAAPLRPASAYISSKTAEFEDELRRFYSEMHPPLPGEAVDDEPLFSGQQYKLYKIGDPHGSFYPEMARVLSLVERVTGLPVGEIAIATRRMELKLARAVTAGQSAKKRTLAVHGLQNSLPLEGYESQQYGAQRGKGGAALRPTNLAEVFQRQESAKESVLTAPKVLKRR